MNRRDPVLHRSSAFMLRQARGFRRARGQVVIFLLVSATLGTAPALGFRVIDIPDLGIGRWNAAPHFVDGVERSLAGGLRYSVTGGSWEAFHDAMQWSGTPPTVQEFQETVEQAFAVWEAMDPDTGLGTNLRFVPDFETEVVLPEPGTPFRLNPGAEIDLVVSDFSAPTLYNLFADPDGESVELASGVANYPATVGAGADLGFSTNVAWDLEHVREFLAWGVPFAIGLQQADQLDFVLSRFYDDNYDGTNSATARETLTNSFAGLIDPLDPDNSPGLHLYNVCVADPLPEDEFACSGDPGISTPGVDLLTEATPEAPAPELKPQHDDFAGRQFLYPFVRLPGDYDADKLLTVEDIDLLFAEMIQPEPRAWFDVTGDGLVTEADRDAWVHELKNTFYGDANLDGEFNSSDLISVFQAGQYEDGIAANSTWGAGDWNGDGDFDTGDLVLAFQDGGFEQGPKAQLHSVPEPSSLAVWSMLCLFLIRHRTLF